MSATSALGRFLVVLVFIAAGFGKMADPVKPASQLKDNYINFDVFMKNKGYSIPIPVTLITQNALTLIYLVAALEIVGGLMITFNVMRQFWAWVLFFFLIPSTVIMHNPFNPTLSVAK
jgi:uncharacterized membrane protein YphA (DoxX/SURF4 family)